MMQDGAFVLWLIVLFVFVVVHSPQLHDSISERASYV